MRIEWLPPLLRLLSSRRRWLTTASRRRRCTAPHVAQLEVLEDRALLAGTSLLGGLLNLPPLTLPDTFNVLQNDTLSSVISLLDNDSDPNNDPLNAQLLLGPLHGNLELFPDGTFNYTADVGFTGLDTFLYTANDGLLGSLLPGLVTLNVLPLTNNTPPVANNDSFQVLEDSILNLSLGTALDGVLANDTDQDLLGLPDILGLGDVVLTASLVTGPQHGSLVFLPTGTFIYTPEPNFTGVDTFTYQASDLLALSNVATVTITVTNVNDAPVAAMDSYSAGVGTPLTVSAANGVLANDTDIDSPSLVAILDTPPSNGSLTLNPNGSFTYVPDPGFIGVDTFTYQASDGQVLSNSGVVTITVSPIANLNTPPVAVIDSYSLAEDSPLTTTVANGVLFNDVDLDGDSLTAILVSGPTHGTLAFNANGTFTYTPALNFNGVDSFVYQANDGQANSNLAVVLLTVTGGNDAPLASNDAYSTDEDVPLVVTAPGVLANDVDPEGNGLQALLVTGPANGVLALNANGSFTYTPNANFKGVDAFIYRATDGSLLSTFATVTITVNSVNDLPVANNDAYSVTEDTSLVVSALTGVLANDADADGNPLTAVLVTQPSHGSVVLQSNGSFVYTPNPNFSGVDTFGYVANDGFTNGTAATVTITVNGINDAPTAAADFYSTNEDVPLNINAATGVLANDADPDGNPLVAVLEAGTMHGVLTLNANGSFQYAPNPNFSGVDTFTYHANDGLTNSNAITVTLTINNVNDVPIAANDAYVVIEDNVLNVLPAAGVLANDTDAEGSPLTAALTVAPTNGTVTLSANGSFVYTPNANFSGTDTFSYTASDGTGTSVPATVTVTVTGVNDAPIAVGDNFTTAEDTPLNLAAPGVLANDTDPDGNALTALLVTGPSNGTLTLNSNGSIVYTPNPNFNGTDSFTYRANDGVTNSNVATVSITISPAAEIPVAVGDTFSTNEDTALVVAAPGVLGNDTDGDGSPLTAILVTGAAHGTVVLNANGSFLYTPVANFSGSDSFTYRASDGSSLSAPATVNITVNNVNDPPIVANDFYSTVEESTLTVPAGTGVLANDADPEGSPLAAVIASLPAQGTLALSANGSFVYTPNANFAGTDTFSYRASDGSTTSAIAVVTITVTGTNDAPTAVADSYTTAEDTVLNVTAAAGVLANDSDPDGNALSAVLVSGPTHGTLTLSPNGALVYTPVANFNGNDSFTYRATDGALNSGTVTVSLTVTSVNDLPVSVNDAYATNEDTVLTVPALTGVLANDSDPDGSPLTAVVVTPPQHGTVVLSPNGSLVYTPSVDFNGVDTFTYRANDGTTNGNLATVTITVNPQNEAPIIVTSAGSQAVRGHKRVILDPALNLIDTDSPNFGGGHLDVAIASGGGGKDSLGYRKGGANKGRVNAKKGVLRIGRIVIGSISGGLRGSPVHIEFNANATQDRVETVMKNLIFRGTKKQVGQRVVALQITDETGLNSNVAIKNVNVT